MDRVKILDAARNWDGGCSHRPGKLNCPDRVTSYSSLDVFQIPLSRREGLGDGPRLTEYLGEQTNTMQHVNTHRGYFSDVARSNPSCSGFFATPRYSVRQR